MTDSSPPRIFVSYGYSDARVNDVMAWLSNSFDTVTALSVVGPLESRGALRVAMESTEGVVGVLPPPGNRDRANVVFEIGVAVGLGLPVVVVAQGEAKLPRSLQGLPTGDIELLASLEGVVMRALRAGPANDSVWPTRFPAKASLQSSRPPGLELSAAGRSFTDEKTRFSTMSETELLLTLESLLRSGSTQVFVPKRQPDQVATQLPDLLIWDDDVLPLLGVPLPVEVIRNFSALPKVRSRLLHTMRASGATSLLAVTVDGRGSRRWSDGREVILTVASATLADALASRPLADVLADLLEAAQT